MARANAGDLLNNLPVKLSQVVRISTDFAPDTLNTRFVMSACHLVFGLIYIFCVGHGQNRSAKIAIAAHWPSIYKTMFFMLARRKPNGASSLFLHINKTAVK